MMFARIVLIMGLALVLSGCDTLRYAGCLARDNTSRPCQ